MKASELRDLTVEELQTKLTELKEELFNLRFQLAVNQLENTSRIGAVKKDIARVSTILRQRELGSLKAELTIGNLVASERLTGHSAAVNSSVFNSFRH